MRKIVIIAVVLAAAIMVSLSFAPVLFPTGSYKNALIRALASSTGADVSIEKFSVKLLPNPAFTIKNVEFKSTENDFRGRTIAKIKDIRGSFSILDVLSHRVDTGLEIRGYGLNYERSPSGITNLDSVFFAFASVKNSISDWNIKVHKITASGGRVDVTSLGGEPGSSVAIPGLELKSLALNQGFVSGEVNLKAAMFGAARPNVSADGRFAFDSKTGTFHLSGGKLFVSDVPISLDANVNLLKSPAQFELHGVSPEIGLSQLAMLFPDLKAGFPAGISWFGPSALDLYVKRDSNGTAIQFHSELTRSNVAVKSIFSKNQGRPMRIEFAGVDRPANLEISALNIILGESVIYMKGSIIHQADHQAQLTISVPTFNFSDVSQAFPFLNVIEGAETPSANIIVRGSLDDPAGRNVAGTFVARTAKIFGMDLGDPSVTFDQNGSTISIPQFRGGAFGGTVTATGEIKTQETPSYNIQAVIGDCDLEKLETLGGTIKGRGALIANMEATGNDPASIESSMKLSGSLVVREGDIPSLKIGQSLFGDQTWELMKASAPGFEPDAQAKTSLGTVDSQVRNLQAAFEKTDNELVISDFRFANLRYVLWLSGKIYAQNMVDALGSVWLDRSEVVKLIPQTQIRQGMVNKNGDLQFPFTVKGRTDGLQISLAKDEFKNVLQGQAFATPTINGYERVEPKPAEPAAKTAEPIDKSKKKERGVKPADKTALPQAAVPKSAEEQAVAPKKPKTPSPAKKSGVTKIPESQSDDVMKVMIR